MFSPLNKECSGLAICKEGCNVLESSSHSIHYILLLVCNLVKLHHSGRATTRCTLHRTIHLLSQ